MSSSACGQRAKLKDALIAGGGAGMMEAVVCHPLGTSPGKREAPPLISVRHHQGPHAALSTRKSPGSTCSAIKSTASDSNAQAKRRGFIRTGGDIVKRETPLGLYKGLGAVLTGIIPKMAIRFTSYDWYKQLLRDKETEAISTRGTFLGDFSLQPLMIHRDRH